MKHSPFFSVVIPLYNKEKSITDTVRSILNQSFSNFELLVVDDGSTDNSVDVVSLIDDERIQLIRKANGGVSSARNRGIREAKCEFIAFIDGDDIWHSEHLSTLKSAIESMDSQKVAGFATSFYKSDISVFQENKFFYVQPQLIDDYFSFVSKPVTKFNSSTIVIKKSKALVTGLFDEHLKYGEDVEFWLRLFENSSLVFVDSATALYFIQAENRSAYNVIPLKKRFHVFNYAGASSSKRRYFDKLIGIMLIDYGMKFSISNLLTVSRMYLSRLPNALKYILSLRK